MTTNQTTDFNAERRLDNFIAERVMVTRGGLGEKVWTRATDLNGERTYLGTRVASGVILADGTHVVATDRREALLAIIKVAGLD
jgi:hypothetical protein